MPVFSLPSPFGIGDMGSQAYSFCDFLAASGQSVWQILPLTITDRSKGNSPYSSISAFAGDPLYISPEILFQEGFLQRNSLDRSPSFKKVRVDYEQARNFRKTILREAFTMAKQKGHSDYFHQFCHENKSWLDDLALFMVLKEHFDGDPWYNWPKGFRERDTELVQAANEQFSEEIDFMKFLQYHFHKQWDSLHSYCGEKGIQILGDIPIYVDHDSCDVWSNRNIFQLDVSGHPASVSGVPPDYFSRTGQRWGNPLFDWNTLEKSGFSWWLKRMGHAAEIFDLVRIDHFRGFIAYWSIPSEEETAVEGHWEKGPSDLFLSTLREQFPNLPVVAENLGIITPDVDEAMKQFDLQGMLVLQFAFDGDMNTNPYLPHNHSYANVVYTGTHDNNTTRGWYKEEITEEQKKILDSYTGHRCNPENISWQLIRLAMGSVSSISIIPMQDILGLDSDARTNTPSTKTGNWEWRVSENYMEGPLSRDLYDMTRLYGRTS